MTNLIEPIRRAALAGVLAAPVAMLASSPASAHPHVWIDMRSDVIAGADGALTGINIEWTFDKNYSASAIEGLDTNKDGYYSSAELAVLTRENLKALKDYNYFVAATAGGAKVAFGDVTRYAQTYSGGRLKMYFTIPFAAPVDPRQAALAYKVYDPTFFIAIEFVDDAPLNLIGKLPPRCTLQLGPEPTGDGKDATRQYLASKGVDWTPPKNEDFGAMFARAVIVACAGKSS